LHPKRLCADSERIYAEQWAKENERQPWLNGGYTLLENVLCPEGQKRPARVSTRDAQVAATVIQWLGTNCGRCFVNMAERKIEEARAVREEWGPVLNMNAEPRPEHLEFAAMVSARFAGDPRQKLLEREICAALETVRRQAVKAALEKELGAK